MENDDLEQGLENKLNVVNSFINSINDHKEMITYFKGKNRNSKKKCKENKTPTSMLKSVDTVVNISATTTSVTLSVTGVRLLVLPMTAEIGGTLSSLVNKITKDNHN